MFSIEMCKDKGTNPEDIFAYPYTHPQQITTFLAQRPQVYILG